MTRPFGTWEQAADGAAGHLARSRGWRQPWLETAVEAVQMEVGDVTKRYRETLEEVELTDAGGGQPHTFRWRGHRYEVVHVLGHWREDPGWWRRPDGQPVRIEQTDMWRVEARNGHPDRGGVYELVRRDGTWKLDRVWD